LTDLTRKLEATSPLSICRVKIQRRASCAWHIRKHLT